MKTNLQEIQSTLKAMFNDIGPELQIRIDTLTNFEIAGRKEVIQAKQKVQGHYFASIIPKPKDIRLYFFPIYTHLLAFSDLNPELQKCLKGKSCFHIKKLSPELETAIKSMLEKGYRLYCQDNLI